MDRGIGKGALRGACRAVAFAVMAQALTVQAVAAGKLATPAEFPPADYRGQQYVDSKGCLFMRAGEGAQTVWIPRVTRYGIPLCGNPPSGKRVPVEGEAGADQSGADQSGADQTGYAALDGAPAAISIEA